MPSPGSFKETSVRLLLSRLIVHDVYETSTRDAEHFQTFRIVKVRDSRDIQFVSIGFFDGCIMNSLQYPIVDLFVGKVETELVDRVGVTGRKVFALWTGKIH
jgi:hypothetical protein